MLKRLRGALDPLEEGIRLQRTEGPSTGRPTHNGKLPKVTKSAIVVILLVLECLPSVPLTRADAPGASLSAFSPRGATVDGIFGPGEWSSAAKFNLSEPPVATSNGLSINGTMFEMNDANHLYLGFRLLQPNSTDITPNLEVNVDLDGADLDAFHSGVDQVSYCGRATYCGNGTSGGHDSVYISSAGTCCTLYSDTFFKGGTNDVVAAASSDGRYDYVEIAHPLCSGDIYDVCLEAGSEIGFHIEVWECTTVACWMRGAFPSLSGSSDSWGEITIAGAVPYRSPPPPPPELLATSTVVTCLSSVFTVGSPLDCTATVNGSSPSGLIWWYFQDSKNRSDVLSPYGTCRLSEGQCTAHLWTQGVTPGPKTVIAYYDGDSVNSASEGGFGVSLYSIVVTCLPTTLTVGSPSVCSVKVSGDNPVGTIAWVSGGTGRFSSQVCRPSRGKCRTTFYTKSASTASSVWPFLNYFNVTAEFRRDAGGPVLTGTYGLVVYPKVTGTVLLCKPSSVRAWSTSAIRCVANVHGYLPTGRVDWTQIGTGRAVFTTSACYLAGHACSVTLIGTIAGGLMVTASYEGDADNYGSSGTFVIAVT